MLEVTDETFEAAWADVNNRRIISGVCRRYRGQVPKEELTYRGYMALFNCLRNHDPNHDTKFTSSLHRHTVWECRKALRSELRQLPMQSLPEKSEPSRTTSWETIYVRDCLDTLPPNHAAILRSYYFERRTFREIGLANGYTPPAAMLKLRQAEEAFRRMYGDD